MGRPRLKEVSENVWRWSWFSDEKGMNFNGYAVRLSKGLVLIDPVYGDEDVWLEIEALGHPAKILLTNKDHERASDELRKRFKTTVAIHEADAGLLSVKPEETFKSGALLMSALQAFHFTGLKSPGECAFYWPQRKTLFIGDAIIGHPAGSVGLVSKHLGNKEILAELKSLEKLDFQALLVCDGQPILQNGKERALKFIREESARPISPSA